MSWTGAMFTNKKFFEDFKEENSEFFIKREVIPNADRSKD